MKLSNIISAAFLASAFALAPTSANAHDAACKSEAIVGTWLTEPKDAKVQIYKLNDRFFGKVIWLKDPNGKDGKPKTDQKNPAPTKRSQPIIGLVNVKGLKYEDDCKWGDGTIYDPKVGKTYKANAELESNGNSLDLRGYVGISLFGRTTTWHRVK